MPEMHRLESSNLHSVGYDPETKTLHVQFGRKGKLHMSSEKTEMIPTSLYHYFDVPQEKFDGLMAVNSAARAANVLKEPVQVGVTAHFNENIKGPKDAPIYKYENKTP